MTLPADLRDWQSLSVSAAARDALALIEADLRGEQDATDKVAFTAISSGTLTAERALALFYKKHALFTLHTRLTQQLKQGKRAGQRLEESNG